MSDTKKKQEMMKPQLPEHLLPLHERMMALNSWLSEDTKKMNSTEFKSLTDARKALFVSEISAMNTLVNVLSIYINNELLLYRKEMAIKEATEKKEN